MPTTLPPPKAANRKAVVFVSLVGVLTATSALLLALSPAPLRPEASTSLFNAGTTPAETLDAIFQTDQPVQPGRWTSILVRQSGTVSGDARSLARGIAGLGDHFVICNGDGGADGKTKEGEIQLGSRWMDQSPALAPAGASAIDRHCISVCLIGDFTHAAPTATQLRRAEQLVTTLQDRCGIAAARVYCLPKDPTGAGAGRSFPVAQFRGQLLP